MAKIKVENVTKMYGASPEEGVRLLDAGRSNQELLSAGYPVGCANVSFEVEEGELLVVMGLSGSGKSTLIRCLNLLHHVTRGHIYIDGEDITLYDQRRLLALRQKKISMVFQHFGLFPHRTVTDNAAYGLEVQGIPVRERRERALEALEMVGLHGWGRAYPGQLSGGMQQRVGLARALAVQSGILLMDEAFSALDPLIRYDMQNELMQLQRQVKKTIVFITHDLNEALKLGDRIVIMKDGRVVQFDTPEEILSHPANEYVKRFTEHVDWSRVLTVKAALSPGRSAAYLHDDPDVVLRKMNEAKSDSIAAVDRDHVFRGTMRRDAVEEAARRGARTVEHLIDTTASIRISATLTEAMAALSKRSEPLPVLSYTGEYLGVITHTGIINALGACGASEPGEAPGSAPEARAIETVNRLLPGDVEAGPEKRSASL